MHCQTSINSCLIFVSLVGMQLILMLLHDSLSLLLSEVKLWAVAGYSSGDMKLNCCNSWFVLCAWCTSGLTWLKTILSSVTCFIAYKIHSDSKQQCLLTFTPGLMNNTTNNTMTDLTNVGNRWKDVIHPSRSWAVHTVDHFWNEGWLNCDQVRTWMSFVCLLTKKHAAVK